MTNIIQFTPRPAIPRDTPAPDKVPIPSDQPAPDNVTPIESAEVVDITPTTTGPCMCIQCKHRWVGTVQVRTTNLECPACGLMKGYREGPVTLPVGTTYWVCGCGGAVFYITDSSHVCLQCGDEAFLK